MLQEKRADRIRSMQRYGPFWVAKDLKGHWKYMKNEPEGDLRQSQIVLHSMVLNFWEDDVKPFCTSDWQQD